MATTTFDLPAIVLPDRFKLMSDQEFLEFCQLNPDWRIERDAQGDVVMMPPTGGQTGRRNLRLGRKLDMWAEGDARGVAFDSSTGFRLPGGALRSPDLAWIARERWDRLSADQQEQVVPLCPDFVLELRAGSDALAKVLGKMHEYIESLTRLGWLIDPFESKVHIFRPGAAVICLERPPSLSGEDVLPGFVLELDGIWR